MPACGETFFFVVVVVVVGCVKKTKLNNTKVKKEGINIYIIYNRTYIYKLTVLFFLVK